MAAGVYDILIEQGATFSKTITLKDNAGAARDLSTVTLVRGQVRRTFQDSTSYAFDLSVMTPASAGQIEWLMDADISATITPATNATWVYDVEMVSAGGVVERILQGKALVSPEVTR